MYRNSPTTNKKFTLAHLKHKFSPHRSENSKKDENNDQKNNGFVLVDPDGTDVVLLQNDTFDQQNTRHPEPCDFGSVDDDNDNVDVNQIHLLSTTPATPSLLPPEQPVLASSIILNTDSRK